MNKDDNFNFYLKKKIKILKTFIIYKILIIKNNDSKITKNQITLELITILYPDFDKKQLVYEKILS